MLYKHIIESIKLNFKVGRWRQMSGLISLVGERGGTVG
jgi:hypothetical protein